jgi:hypothetical protein
MKGLWLPIVISVLIWVGIISLFKPIICRGETMKTIELKVPDTFTDAQVNFIKNSALNQIEAELKATLKVPQADIDAVEAQVAQIKKDMGIITEIKEVKDDFAGPLDE